MGILVPLHTDPPGADGPIGAREREAEERSVPVRDVEVQRVVDLVVRGRSVRLIGGRWSGRTSLLRAVEHALTERGRDVFRVTGARDVPDLEVLRVSLPPRVGGELGAHELAFAQVYAVLQAHLSGGGHTLVIDDADLLDESSRGVVRLLHQRLGVPVVATTLPSRDREDAGAWLAETSQPLVQLHLDGMPVEDLHELLHERAGGPVAPSVGARIHSDSAGIPGLALAILDGAIGHGALHRVGDTWTGEHVWSPEMQGVYATYLASHRPEVRDAVGVLAVTGALPFALALQLLGAEMLDELDATELIQTVPAGAAHLVVLNPPGLADYVDRHRLTGRHRRLLTAAIERIVDGRPVPDEETARVLARLRGRLDRGEGAGALTTAPSRAEFVGGIFAQGLGADVTAATEQWRGGKRVRDAVPLLRVLLCGTRDRLAIENVLAQTDLTTDVETFEYVELCYHRARWLVAQGVSVAEVEAQVGRHLPPAMRYREAVSSLLYAVAAEFDGLPADYEDVLAPRTAAPGLDAAAARVALAACHTIAGRHERTVAVLDVDRQEWPRFLQESADALVGLSLYGRGDFLAGLAHGRATASRATAELSRSAYVSGCLLTALCLGARLELDAARRELFPVLSSGAMAGTLVLPPDRAVRVLLAALSIYSSHESVSAGLLDLASADYGCGEALPFANPAWTTAMELYAHGRAAEAAGVLDDVSARLRAKGFALAADVTEMNRMIVELDPARAPAFAAVAQRLGGPLYVAYLDAKQASYDRKPQDLVRVAHRLADEGVAEQAVRCYLNAAGMFLLDGDPVAAAEARAAARALQARRQLPPARADAAQLTEREWEVVELVALGHSNAAVAERLFLSPRTVESHLRNIRRKTGVENRAAVASLSRG